MPMTFRFARCALAVGFALATRSAAAAEFGAVSFPPRAVFPYGAATDFQSVVIIPKQSAGLHGFVLSFVLPQDYKKNAKVQVVVHVTTSAPKPCRVVFRPQQLTRWRPGAAPLIESAGLAPASGSNIIAFRGNAVVERVFTVERDPAFAGGQRAGDGLRVALGRDGGHASDTCNGALTVMAIDIRYPRTP